MAFVNSAEACTAFLLKRLNITAHAKQRSGTRTKNGHSIPQRRKKSRTFSLIPNFKERALFPPGKGLIGSGKCDPTFQWVGPSENADYWP